MSRVTHSEPGYLWPNLFSQGCSHYGTNGCQIHKEVTSLADHYLFLQPLKSLNNTVHKNQHQPPFLLQGAHGRFNYMKILTLRIFLIRGFLYLLTI